MRIDMPPELKEMFKEFLACNALVYDENYTVKEKRLMKALEKEGLVKLAWVLTPKGQKEHASGSK